MQLEQKITHLKSKKINISIKKSINIELFFAVFASISYPILFIFVFGANFETIIYSFIHAVLAGLFIYRLVSKSLLNQHGNLRMPVIFILINALYFNASSVKYFEPQLYLGYLSNDLIRFMFSMLVLLGLWSAFEVLNRQWRPKPLHQLTIRRVNALRIVIFLILIGVIHAIIIGYHQGPGYLYQWQVDPSQLAIEHTYLSTSEKLADWLSGLYPFLLPVFLGLYYKQRGGVILIVISAIVMLAYSLISGSRGIFFVFGAGLFVSLTLIKNVGRKIFSWLIFSAPLVIALLSVIALTISKRVDLGNKDLIRWQLAYRFDLSDFAATLATHRGFINFDHNLLFDAIYRAMPKAILPEKFNMIVNAYPQQLYKIGLNPYIDYNDTFFSIGAQLFGGIGFVVFPISMILFLHTIEKYIFHIFGLRQGYVVIVCMFMLYSSAESDLDGLFDTWRMLPVFILLGLFIFRFIVKPVKHSPAQRETNNFVSG